MRMQVKNVQNTFDVVADLPPELSATLLIEATGVSVTVPAGGVGLRRVDNGNTFGVTRDTFSSNYVPAP